MKKLFSVFTVILLLAALSVPVCADEAPTLTFEMRDAMLTAYWNTYVVMPLSAELKQEIEDTWPDKDYPIEIYDIFYYGEYNGAHVFLEPLPNADMTRIEVAGYVLEWGSAFNVHVYREGSFLSLPEAYEQQWLTESNIRNISILADSTTYLNVEYLGEYDGCHVGFLNGGPFHYTTEEMLYTIGGYTFLYPDSHQLDVYKDGQMMSLEKAYASGWLSDAAVGRLWNDYIVVYYDGVNPHSGDEVWIPAALLIVSGAALLMVVSRKRAR